MKNHVARPLPQIKRFGRAPKPRKGLRIDLDAVRRAAMAEGLTAEQVEERLRAIVAEGDRIDSGTRTRAALALAREAMDRGGLFDGDDGGAG